MNASQRRIIRRAVSSALSVVGIKPGATVERKGSGKATATPARVEVVTFDYGRPLRPLLQVKRRDRQTATWPAAELVRPVTLTPARKQHHAPRFLAHA